MNLYKENQHRIYRLLFIAFVILGMASITYAQQKKDSNERASNPKILIAYFSATGNTAGVAKILADVTGGELYEIESAQPYTKADLNWNDRQSRSSVEMNNPNARVAIKHKKENIADYDIIFIGHPIWWNRAPRIINTFIENHILEGKTIITFATSGSSSIEGSVAELKKTYPKLNLKEGRLLNRADEKTIRAWVEKLRS